MLQKLSHHIEACVERVADCRRRAEQAADPTMKLELQDIEGRWTNLARSYECVESLERFLLSGQDDWNRRTSSK
jgi:hypothetical protein